MYQLRPKSVIALFVSLTLLTLGTPSVSVAVVVPGSICKKVGLKQVYKKKIYTCIKLGRKLYWDNGNFLSPSISPKSTQSSRPTPAVTPLATPSPTTSLAATSNPPIVVLPKVSDTYFGLTGNVPFDSCWFAKKVNNDSGQVSVAARQVTDVVGLDGLIRGEIWWMIPSLLPGQTVWLSNYFGSYTNSRGCNEKPSRVFDRPLAQLSLSTGSPTSETRLTTGELDRPKVLEVVQIPVPGTQKITFKLRVQNQSADKVIVRNSLSFINFIFLNAAGIPIYALSGPITGDIPPRGEALLQGSASDIPDIAIPPGTASIVGSLNFVLCKKETYPQKDVCSY